MNILYNKIMKIKLLGKVKQGFVRTIIAILGITLIIYFINVSLIWGRFDNFNFLMDIVGLLLIIISIKFQKIREKIKKLPKFVKIILKAVFICFALSFIITESIIVYNMNGVLKKNVDYVIVLGCQVDGSIPSIPLMRRINIASKYLKENMKTKVVVTGGKGRGENISEAEAMRNVLIRSGINTERIFIENNATSTKENLKFSDELYDLSNKDIIIVSSDYHMYRALSMAKKLKYKNVAGLPCKSQVSMLPAYLAREYVAVMYYKLLGRI
ncbi:hypothetical protein FACS1894130_10320 [Spirochaetia bacterium]|nr:hypothetical protein FACS1894130_10320 [Spirochaetia bacterium]